MGEYKFTLRQARAYSGLSQKDIAKHLHITPNTIVNWEKGATTIDARSLKELSKLYNIPEADIFLPDITE